MKFDRNSISQWSGAEKSREIERAKLELSVFKAEIVNWHNYSLYDLKKGGLNLCLIM